MSFKEKVREKIINYLDIREMTGLSINIEQLLDFEAETFQNRLWMRGNANELETFYEQIDRKAGVDRHFWGAKSTIGAKVRKIHTGLPRLIVKKLTNVCTDDLQKIEVKERQAEWDAIAKDNNFKKLIRRCVSDVLAYGDGAFKLSYDPQLSEHPIIEFFAADRVEYEYKRGRLLAVIFKTEKVFKKKKYILKERYTKESITYTLENAEGEAAEINSFPELADLKPIINKAEFIPAVPVMFYESTENEGRGESVFKGKYDSFDGLDEVVSQWMLALRKGQIKSYIPEDLLPRDPETGAVLKYNALDTDFVSVEKTMTEGSLSKIETTQGTIQHEALLSTYCTMLDLCLQGIISPATLGIDVKKLDNAEAQREKEKTTIYTRNEVVAVLQEAIKDVVITALRFKDNIAQKSTEGDITVTVNFGGYANPSFEAQVETVGKAVTAGVMSTEASVEELYGDSKDNEWKKQEVRRIKEERGIAVLDEPSVA